MGHRDWRVDINTDISLLSSYQAAPRQGHLEQLLHIVAFLKKRPKLTLYFDPSHAVLDKRIFNGNNREQFQDHYRVLKKKYQIGCQGQGEERLRWWYL